MEKVLCLSWGMSEGIPQETALEKSFERDGKKRTFVDEEE